MKAPMRLLPISLGLCVLASCETLTGVAPKETPRVECEVAIELDESFLTDLAGVDMSSELITSIKEVVREEANLGLRFYPTLSESYSASDQRPPHLMTIGLESLTLLLDHDTIEHEGAEPEVQTTLDKVGCSVTASVKRRRDQAPPLLIASSSATSEIRAEREAEVVASASGYQSAGEVAGHKVLEQDIIAAVRTATEKALRQMRTPIDRELVPPEPEPVPTPAPRKRAANNQ